MAHILFLGFPAHGHTNPTLPLVAALASRGHEIEYWSAPVYADRVRAAGAMSRAYSHGFLARPESIDPVDFAARAPEVLLESTLEFLEHDAPSLESRRFDLVIFDSLAAWGPCLAERMSLPCVSSISTFALHREMASLARGFARPTWNRIRKKTRAIWRATRMRRVLRSRFGVNAPSFLRIYCNRGDLDLVYTSRELQPGGDSLDERYRFVGPSLGDRGDSSDFPWERIDGATRTILVSLGTSFHRDPHLLRTVIEAFTSDVIEATDRIVVAHGDLDPAELGSPPDNVILHPHVPQLDILARADLFVTRGGMNSVSESLWHGVPVLTLPFLAEQAVVGRRAEQLGAGKVLPVRDAAGQHVARLAREILEQPSFRRHAAELGSTLRGAGGAERAADEIESMIGSPRPRP